MARGAEGWTQERLDREFASFQEGDADTTDAVVRCVAVFGCAVALWIALSNIAILIWGASYVLFNIAYVSFVRREAVQIPKRVLIVTIFGSTFISSWYVAMLIYLASVADGDFLVIAACGAIGAALHSFSHNSEFSLSAFIDFSTAVVSAAGVFVFAAVHSSSFWVAVSILLGGLFIIGYLLLGFRLIISDRRELKEKYKADVHDQKMRALGQLTSGVAHDFNNLLAVVLLNIELSLDQPSAEKRKKHLSDAQQAAQSGAELIEQLMAFGRTSDLQSSNVLIAPLFDRLKSVLRRLLPSRIEFEVSNLDPSCEIHVDAAMLESAILNLVINARDAIGANPGKVSVLATPNRSTGVVDICVSDTGPGMDAETLARACEPFFTTKSVGEGSGLGLSMVKGFAEQSGGELILRNSERGGLLACLRLPMLG
ncbi:MAG: ATP-binding protein [Pseudomonadota bacterium]